MDPGGGKRARVTARRCGRLPDALRAAHGAPCLMVTEKNPRWRPARCARASEGPAVECCARSGHVPVAAALAMEQPLVQDDGASPTRRGDGGHEYR
jgi:hypothetical protein